MCNSVATKTVIMLCTCFYVVSAKSAVVELLPGQNQPILTPLTALTIGTSRSQYLGSYESSQRQGDQKFTDQETGLTLSHNNVAAGIPYILVTSLGHREVGYQEGNNKEQRGEGGYDLRLAAGFWPWIDPIHQHHLGLALVSTLPTGSYDRDNMMNAGENRYRLTGILNFKYQLLPHWYSESFILYNWLSDNTHYKASASYIGSLSQSPSMSWTSYLAYQSPQKWQAYFGLEQTIGSNQELDNELYTKGQADFRGYLGTSFPLDNHNIIQFRYGQSIMIETGYRQEHQFILKISHLW